MEYGTTTTHKNMIMYQLKAFKHYIHYRNKQLDGMNTECEIFDNNNSNVFSITLSS